MLRKKIKKSFVIFLLLSINTLYFLNQLIKNKENNLKIYFLESGQADSILIKTPEKQNIIIDLGSQIGLKKLNQKIPWWDKKINLLIITHPHDDHIAGIPLLLEKYKIEKIIFTGIECETPLYQEILKQIKNKKIDLLIPQEKQKIILGKKCELNFLYPQESLNKKTIENLNNSSIINQLKCNGIISLFMGDAEEIVEKKILEKNYNLKSDILKIGHHGSISSSHQEFLEKVKPKISIIMVGEKNKFNHPHLRTIKKLQKIGSLIFRTDLNGTITVKVEEGKIGYQIEKSTQQIIY